jgi:hypothetical protein
MHFSYGIPAPTRKAGVAPALTGSARVARCVAGGVLPEAKTGDGGDVLGGRGSTT